jgi:EAL domain-containing protein (putative c-di-GMP-specific phosphodiesterase class I)/ActR/RegA family two-component response regulator
MDEHPLTESPRLLVVDDDQLVGETIRQMARRDGFEVRFTCEAARFLELVETWSPDVVAIDLVMPDMDGVQVLNELAERAFDACIVLTSGVGHRVLDAARRSAREHGLRVVGVLPKPFRHADLRDALADCSNGRSRAGEGGATRSESPEITDQMLAAGLERDEIVPYFQPKIACADGALAGFEALARWKHPDSGLIPPGAFIPLAEHSGRIVPLTARIVSASLEWFGRVLRDRGSPAPPLRLSLNLSARTLEDTELLDRIAADCRRFGVPADALVFELTETAAMADATASLDLLTRLRVSGYHLAIDDFGTGYSSMVQLVRLPFSELKIDKSFVLSARESEESREVVRSVVELGRSLGLTTTAEGVADEWTLDFVRSLGCDYAQGFHFGRPESGDRIRELWAV